MPRIASLEYSDDDGVWFPVTEVTRDDTLLDALRKGHRAKAVVTGNAADGRAISVSLAGSYAAIEKTLQECEAASAGA